MSWLKSNKYCILFILLFNSVSVYSFDIKIRIHSAYRIENVSIENRVQSYFVIALDSNGEIIDTVVDLLDSNQRSISLTSKGSKIQLKRGESAMGLYDRLFISAEDSNSVFSINGSRPERVYKGHLELWSTKGELILVNHVNIEEYVAGVVESEGGHLPAHEFFKAQAVLARTFAMKNINKHSKEGYNLKDDVTSQVYHSMARYKHSEDIRNAVYETRDSILVDLNCKPILAAFHANSGGQTANSEEAWLTPVSYLRSRPDAFSLKGPSATWEKEVSKSEFYQYFASRMGFIPQDIGLQKAILNLVQDQRISEFKYKGKSLALKHVRRHFHLRSTFFTVVEKGNYLVLKGKGYGHGVGMSQDGAIIMSDLGYCYKEILYFYYSQVDLEMIQRL